jgi:hypothetical protein
MLLSLGSPETLVSFKPFIVVEFQADAAKQINNR